MSASVTAEAGVCKDTREFFSSVFSNLFARKATEFEIALKGNRKPVKKKRDFFENGLVPNNGKVKPPPLPTVEN